MNFFNFKPNKDLIKRLNESKQDFRFDHNRVKARLLYSLQDAPMVPARRPFFTTRFTKYSVSAAVPLVFLSVIFLFASNARPGEKLFALNKFGETVILSLPLSVEQKAQVHADIVTRRLEALLEIEDIAVSNELEIRQPEAQPEVKESEPAQPETKQSETKQLEAKKPKTKQSETQSPETKQLKTKQLQTIKESDESIKDAIETVSKDKQRLENSGQKAKAEKLGKVLNQIDDLAKKHEDRIKTLEASLSDQNEQQEIDEHLKGIKKSRQKAKVELNLQESKDDNSVKPKAEKKKTDKPKVEPKSEEKTDNSGD